MEANMALYPGDDADPEAPGWLGGNWSEAPDPKDVATFKDHHVVSELFMRTILFHEPWASAGEAPGVRVRNAHIRDSIDWRGRKTRGGLWLDACRIEHKLRIQDMHVAGLLSLQGAVLAGGMTAAGLQVDGDLFCMNDFVSEQEIRLIGARIGGVASFIGATLKGKLTADRLQVDGSLSCVDGFVAEEQVRLVNARIGGQAAFVGATLRGALTADGLQVDGALFLREMKRLGDTVLVRAKIGSDLQLRESRIEGEIDLTGAAITGELHMDMNAKTLPDWGDKAKLVLRNASAGALGGRLAAFRRIRNEKAPKQSDFVPMDLAGFRYGALGGLLAEPGDTLAAAKAGDLKRWLAAGTGDGKTFNPDPYRQLARALERAGHANKARDILHAMAVHERDTADFFRRIMLTLSGVFIGFGYRNGQAVLWFTLLVLLGAAMGMGLAGYRWDFSSAGWDHALRWAGFSLGNAVPLVELDEAHKTFLAEAFGKQKPSETPPGAAWAFYAHKLMGLVILSYLAAGLSGLARRGREE
jgi:hypothetical protein